MATNSKGVMVTTTHGIIFGACLVVLAFVMMGVEFVKIRNDIGFLNKVNITQTRVINKQGKAVSALIEHAGLDEEEILKGE